MSQKDPIEKDVNSLDDKDNEVRLYLKKNKKHKRIILTTIIILWFINMIIGFMVDKYRGTGTGMVLFLLGFYMWGWMDTRKALKIGNTELSVPKQLTIFVGGILILSFAYIFWLVVMSFL